MGKKHIGNSGKETLKFMISVILREIWDAILFRVEQIKELKTVLGNDAYVCQNKILNRITG